MNNEIINKCVKVLLRPFVKFCLKYSIKLQDIYELIKYNLVILAKEELVNNKLDANASRITLITGVHRPDITRILSEGIKTNNNDQITKIIGQWQSDKRFTTPAGRPKTLEVVGKESEFVELVRTVNKELNPYTILFELERIGAVTKTSKGLKLISKGFDATKDSEAGFTLLANDIDDLINSVENNILNTNNSPNHHIKTEYDRIPNQHADEIKAWIQEKGAEFHKDLRDYLSKFDKDINPKVASNSSDCFIRVAVGSNCAVSIVKSIVKKEEDNESDN